MKLPDALDLSRNLANINLETSKRIGKISDDVQGLIIRGLKEASEDEVVTNTSEMDAGIQESLKTMYDSIVGTVDTKNPQNGIDAYVNTEDGLKPMVDVYKSTVDKIYKEQLSKTMNPYVKEGLGRNLKAINAQYLPKVMIERQNCIDKRKTLLITEELQLKARGVKETVNPNDTKDTIKTYKENRKSLLDSINNINATPDNKDLMKKEMAGFDYGIAEYISQLDPEGYINAIIEGTEKVKKNAYQDIIDNIDPNQHEELLIRAKSAIDSKLNKEEYKKEEYAKFHNGMGMQGYELAYLTNNKKGLEEWNAKLNIYTAYNPYFKEKIEESKANLDLIKPKVTELLLLDNIKQKELISTYKDLTPEQLNIINTTIMAQNNLKRANGVDTLEFSKGSPLNAIVSQVDIDVRRKQQENIGIEKGFTQVLSSKETNTVLTSLRKIDLTTEHGLRVLQGIMKQITGSLTNTKDKKQIQLEILKSLEANDSNNPADKYLGILLEDFIYGRDRKRSVFLQEALREVKSIEEAEKYDPNKDDTKDDFLKKIANNSYYKNLLSAERSMAGGGNSAVFERNLLHKTYALARKYHYDYNKPTDVAVEDAINVNKENYSIRDTWGGNLLYSAQIKGTERVIYSDDGKAMVMRDEDHYLMNMGLDHYFKNYKLDISYIKTMEGTDINISEADKVMINDRDKRSVNYGSNPGGKDLTWIQVGDKIIAQMNIAGTSIEPVTVRTSDGNVLSLDIKDLIEYGQIYHVGEDRGGYLPIESRPKRSMGGLQDQKSLPELLKEKRNITKKTKEMEGNLEKLNTVVNTLYKKYNEKGYKLFQSKTREDYKINLEKLKAAGDEYFKVLPDREKQAADVWNNKGGK